MRLLTGTNTDVRSVREHTSSHGHKLARDENIETLAPLAPPPITHAASTPSSQLSQLQKLYKYTHTHTFALTHTHHFLFFFFFSLLTPFPAHHGSLQLVLALPTLGPQLACKSVLHVCAVVVIVFFFLLSLVVVVAPAERSEVLASAPAAPGRKPVFLPSPWKP